MTDAKVVPIKLAERKVTVTTEEVQGWVDNLSERDSGFLRLLMEHCVLQGRSEALHDAINVALAAQQMCKPKSGARAMTTKVVSSLMQGRMQTLEATQKKGFG